VSHQARLNEKVVVITGGANGIGKASAKLFSGHGAKIAILDIDGLVGEDLVQSIKAANGEAFYFNVNIARADSVKEAFRAVENEFGRIDVLFNNAGIMHHQDGEVVDLDEKTWDLTMSVNAKGVFLSCKYGLPALIRAGAGSIINTASFAALCGMSHANMAYSASKAAIISLTKNIAISYANKNIRSNALLPGPTLTESFQRSLLLEDEAKKQQYLNAIPLARFGDAEELAKAALFLASDDSSYITGTEFLVDGGLSTGRVL